MQSNSDISDSSSNSSDIPTQEQEKRLVIRIPRSLITSPIDESNNNFTQLSKHSNIIGFSKNRHCGLKFLFKDDSCRRHFINDFADPNIKISRWDKFLRKNSHLFYVIASRKYDGSLYYNPNPYGLSFICAINQAFERYYNPSTQKSKPPSDFYLRNESHKNMFLKKLDDYISNIHDNFILKAIYDVLEAIGSKYNAINDKQQKQIFFEKNTGAAESGSGNGSSRI